jgi:hypothetical protein
VTGSGMASGDNGPCGQAESRFHTPVWIPTAGVGSVHWGESLVTLQGEGRNLAMLLRGQGRWERPWRKEGVVPENTFLQQGLDRTQVYTHRTCEHLSSLVDLALLTPTFPNTS